MSKRKVKLAISTCPNDTFAFHAILNRKVDCRGIEFDIELLDIQQLNDGLFQDRFDFAKASFHAAALLADRYDVLPSGSALGFGVGPLLLAASDDRVPSGATDTILCPGQHTTATLLYRLFYPDCGQVRQTVFSSIMPALAAGDAEFGVCIHEGRFTWREQGLYLVEDLGLRWENETSSPLPLGGILARRDLDKELVARVQDTIRDSIDFANANRKSTVSTMKNFAQEFEDDVLFQHVDLYVNEWTTDLGELGARALQLLSSKAKKTGAVPPEVAEIHVWKR